MTFTIALRRKMVDGKWLPVQFVKKRLGLQVICIQLRYLMLGMTMTLNHTKTLTITNHWLKKQQPLS